MKYSPINFQDKFNLFSDQWSPKIIAQMNNYHFKLVKFRGEFVWHDHADTDEVFIVLDGEMSIRFKDGDVMLKKGEMFVVPKGVTHKPFSERECRIMLVEPVGTINTGTAGGVNRTYLYRVTGQCHCPAGLSCSTRSSAQCINITADKRPGHIYG